jgi:hypothetical protein
MTDRFDVLERYAPLFDAPEPSFEGFVRHRDRRRRNQRIAAGVVGIAVFLAAVAVITTSPADRSITPGGGGTPQPTIAPEASNIVGLPALGALPSTPERGRLVLSLEGGAGGAFTAMWVYADGRLIWGDLGNLPVDAPIQGATGLVEQHITPAWIDYLQSEVISTGLFEHDLALLRGQDDPGFLAIGVRNGGRLVSLKWAVQETNAPPATPEQVSTLEGLYAFLADPTSWPARAWEDQDPRTFVPTRYQVWLRLFDDRGPDLRVGAREVALLPEPAADLFRDGTYLRRATYEMSTDDARALAAVLIEAGLAPLTMPMGEAVTRFELDDPYEPGSSLYIFFGPVLPHGEAVFLGPG